MDNAESSHDWDGAQTLTDVEKVVVRFITTHQSADLETLNHPVKPTIRAFVIRAMLLNCVSAHGLIQPQSVPGLRITKFSLRWATVSGCLNLSDLTGPENLPLPEIDLQHCIIDSKINLDFSHIARISIIYTEFTSITALGCRMDGPFLIFNCRPLSSEAWIDARNSNLGGDVKLVASVLRSPTAREGSDLPIRDRKVALNLANAEVHGSIEIFESRVVGGVKCQNSRIASDVWIVQSRLIARESDAFGAQGANILGSLIFRDSVFIYGPVWLFAVRIGGTLEFSQTRLRPRFQRDENAIVGMQMTVSDKLTFYQARVIGVIEIDNARIHSDVTFNSVTIGHSETVRQSGLSSQSVNFGAGLSIYDCRCIGVMSFRGSTVKGAFTCVNPISVSGRLTWMKPALSCLIKASF